MNFSFSKLKIYTECGLKYKYHYLDRIRPKNIHGALIFGGALDRALNVLLEEKNLDKAKAAFERSYRFQKINGVDTYLPQSTSIVYAKRDFDEELLTSEDLIKLKEFVFKSQYSTDDNILQTYYDIVKLKETKGFKNLTKTEKQIYNIFNWFSMKNKGIIMLDSYNKKILPRIKEVLSVQETIYLDNGIGDKIQSILDLIITWEDGKRYVADNKTSSIKYADDSAKKSPQLMGYYHAAKTKYKIDGGVAFIVLDKAIKKNRTKVCSSCGFVGTGTRYQTCNNILEFRSNDGKVKENTRCNSSWTETISPEAVIEPILNTVNPTTEALVLHTYDEAIKGIKAKMFGPNLNSCGTEYFKCVYYDLCYNGKKDDLIDLGKKDETT